MVRGVQDGLTRVERLYPIVLTAAQPFLNGASSGLLIIDDENRCAHAAILGDRSMGQFLYPSKVLPRCGLLSVYRLTPRTTPGASFFSPEKEREQILGHSQMKHRAHPTVACSNSMSVPARYPFL
jgi:hypothetical protein